MGERFSLLVEALADDVPAPVRLRQLLKVALRRFRLRCVELGPPPDAWYGWRRQPNGEWARICCACTEELCRELLTGRAGVCVVLPKGRFPHEWGGGFMPEVNARDLLRELTDAALAVGCGCLMLWRWRRLCPSCRERLMRAALAAERFLEDEEARPA